MEKTKEIVSIVSGSDPMVLALMVTLAGIALGALALWALMCLHVRRDKK